MQGVSVGCVECGYPVSVSSGNPVSCPMCHTIQSISEGGVDIFWKVVIGVALAVGAVFAVTGTHDKV